MKKKIKLKKFEDDLKSQLSKSERAIYEVEYAKLQLAHKLAESRDQMGLTQKELADKMGVKQQIVSRIESGSENITLGTLISFCYSLGIVLKIGVQKRKSNHHVLAVA
jgi:DNA-binding XRE family transcriptional regulator